MSAHSPELKIKLKPFVHTLMNEPATIFRWENRDGLPVIDWFDKEVDEEIFQQIVNYLFVTADWDDELFVQEGLPAIEAMLGDSPLFSGLKSREIVVTEPHKGVTPYEHTMNVVRELNTASVPNRDVVLLRLLAVYHDIGKGAAAGLRRDEIEYLMEKHGHEHHSHPSHAELAVLALRELINGSKTTLAADETFWEDFEFIVLEHHIFSDLAYNNKTTEEVVNYFKSLNIRDLALVYLLCRADLGSTAGHREHWPKNVQFFVSMFDTVWKELSSEQAQPFYLALLLLKELE
jgi:hypothetical protein